jgi:7-carboxy-7-deazaguanine synthase
MQIAEIFQSVQGEGFLTGTPSIFVRTAGCNLRCRYCDTPYASWHPEGEPRSVTQILTEIQQWDCRHVVLTGGEPMLHAESIALCEQLQRQGKHITVETAGTLYLPLACDLMSISPKLDNSTPAGEQGSGWRSRHEAARHVPGVIRQLMVQSPYQFKFVVGQPCDVEHVLRYLDEIPQIDRGRVMLMPMGTGVDELARVAEWLVGCCSAHGLHYCPRRQIEWFGLVRGT